jgi:hypothetical protein
MSNRIIQRRCRIPYLLTHQGRRRSFLPFLVGWIRKNLQMETNVVDAEQVVGNPARGGAACCTVQHQENVLASSQGEHVHCLPRWDL